jgi:flagellar hook-associated protein 3 FlgL
MYNGNQYQTTFTLAAGVTTYSIVDVTTPPGTAVAGQTNVPYVSGQSINFNGIQFSVEGAPANGDVFNVTPGTNQSIFTTMSDLIATLNAPVVSGNTAYQQGLNYALTNLDQGLNNILKVRATLGGRMNEIDAMQATGDALGTQYKQTLSKLQDVDYLKAISDLTQQQTTLDAALKSFSLISKMSLFNYL